jgi:mono/diheme cytochrome c family protein
MNRSKIQNQLALFVSMAALAMLLAPAGALAGDAAAGKTAYTVNCLSCHGETGKGDGPVGMVLQPPPRDFSTADFKFDSDGDGKPGSDADLKAVVAKGAGAFGGNQMMAAWGGVLSDEDIDNVVAYIRTLKQ